MWKKKQKKLDLYEILEARSSTDLNLPKHMWNENGFALDVFI